MTAYYQERDEPAEHPEDCECKWCIVPEVEDKQ